MASKVEAASHVRAILADADSVDGIPFRAKTGHLHNTWAQTFSSLPELYVQPESLEEIEKVINLARKWRRRIATAGCGHSPSALTCTSSWLINLDNFNRVLSLDKETGIVVVQAGIRLYQFSEALNDAGLAMPNLGSINEQSMAGVISTGTHGSSLKHGLLSEDILNLRITLASGKTEFCSPEVKPDLFRAALLSLGALGIITEVTFRAVPAFSLQWQQTMETQARILKDWNAGLWDQSHFVRVWWLPYSGRAVRWQADVVSQEDLKSGRVAHRDPPVSYYDGTLGYLVYHNLLYLGRYVPRIIPWVEWFIFSMQYGFGTGPSTQISGVQPSRQALLMNCLYSQYVNEWAIPLEKGPEALRRLTAWFHKLKPGDPGYVDHKIPFSSDGIWVHAPVEVRVSDSTLKTSSDRLNRPWLDPTPADGPALYLNAIMYRPYRLDPPGVDRYYQAFEWLMKDLGGKPHWAKNFSATGEEIESWYGADLQRWRSIRDDADPEGLFVGSWHRNHVVGGKELPLEEREVSRSPSHIGSGVEVHGAVGPRANGHA